MSEPTIPCNIQLFKNSVRSTELEYVPAELPVLLTVNGEPWLEFMCTPEHLEALAAGFLYNEGLIETVKDIEQLYVCPAGDNIDVWTVHAIEKPMRWQRTSGCAGGMTTSRKDIDSHLEEIPIKRAVLPENIKKATLSTSQINEMVFGLFMAQKLHRQSGGIHASAISDGRTILLSCEDIGRHNTLDKLAGRLMLEKISGSRRAILTTGRISSEMLEKAKRMEIAVVVSSTSPTSMAVQMADRWGLTLIGYAHGESFKVYTHPERIKLH